ncbi:MAG: hypothetical protein JO038_05065 [Alphaproteobacteria bacterium]|nr:hypothetical protein [Alphaproteobacteria bacterium]
MRDELVYPDVFMPTRSDAELHAAGAARSGLSCADLVKKFESLGNDCEFGFLQRRCGAEPLGLFRFSNPSHEVILRAIQADFEGFGDDAYVELDQQQPRREWIVVDPVNGLRQHTFMWEGDKEEREIQEQQLTRFKFCVG